MTDAALRALERSDDPRDALRLRYERWRRGEDVGFEVGDEVEVDESTNVYRRRWRADTWTGAVVRIRDGVYEVMPSDVTECERQTIGHMLGLPVGHGDRVTLLEPAARLVVDGRIV